MPRTVATSTQASSWLRVFVASSTLTAVALSVVGTSAGAQEPQPPRRRAVVAIAPEGQYRFGDSAVKREELPQRISDGLDGAPVAEQVVDLIAGESVRYGAVKDVLLIMREIGYDQVRLAVRREAAATDDALLGARLFPPPPGVKAEVSGLPPLERPARPQTSAPPPRVEPAGMGLDASDIVVELKADGRTVAVNGREMPLAEMQPLISPILKSGPVGQKWVAFKAPAEVTFKQVAEALLEIEDAEAEIAFLILDELEMPRELVPRPSSPPEVSGAVPGGAPTTPPGVQRVSGGVLNGKAIQRAQPSYPPEAAAAKVHGAVVVEVTVDETGKVMGARAISGPLELRDVSIDAARRWKFAPVLLSGKPVKVIGTITFNFAIEP